MGEVLWFSFFLSPFWAKPGLPFEPQARQQEKRINTHRPKMVFLSFI
jgi:hypothetical protein